MNENIIETFDLTKIYHLKGRKKQISALNNINISIRKGEIFGLLGPNGAGKTTLIQILTTLLQPTSGYALIDGYNILKKPKQAKKRVSLMLESDMLYYRITGYDNLKFFCKIYKVPNYNDKIHRTAEDFMLNKWLKQYVEYYSSGMKMKLALLKTFLLNRDIMFLDEPTLGLDIKTKLFVIDKLKNINKTIFISSHDMSVVEKLCDRIAFIDQGNILKIGTRQDITKLMQSKINIQVDLTENKNQLKSELDHQEFITEIIETKNGLSVNLKTRKNYKEFLYILSKYDIFGVREQKETLEDLFIKII